MGEGAESSTRTAVRELFEAGHTVAEIAALLGLSKPTVCHHARKLGIPKDERFSKRYDWTAVQRYYDAGHSVAACQAEFGFAKASWDGAVKRGVITPRPAAVPMTELLVAGVKRNRWNVKRRLLEAGYKREECEDCGLTEWRGRPISFELHHVNGDGTDNRLENLRILCPNCHTQTETFGARNKGRRAG